MLENYFVIAFRNLRKQPLYTTVSVVGLAVGLACCLLVTRYVQHERSYDDFHEASDRVFRLTYEEFNTPAMRHLATVSPPMGPALVDEYPEVVDFVRLRTPDRAILAYGDTQFYEQNFFYADSSFFKLFSFPLAHGDPATALQASNTVVLTAEAARKYFGDRNPVGEIMRFNNEEDLTVTGVMEPLPANTHLQFDCLISFSTFRVPLGYPVTLESWGWISFHTYLLLAENTNAEALEAKLTAFMRNHFADGRADRARLQLQPVSDIYLGTPEHHAMKHGSTAYLYGLSAIAVLILLLACFNFTNLSTAQALRRHKEVGVRKVLGAERRQVRMQFYGEATLVALLSLVVALALVQGGAAISTSWLGLSIPMDHGALLKMLGWGLGVAALAVLIAGSYPAIMLARFRPGVMLNPPVGGASGRLRGALVVLQFSITVGLVVASLVIAQQMRFIQTKDLGFDKEEVIAVHMLGSELLGRYPAMREVLLQNPHVVNVSRGGNLFDGDQGSVPITPEGNNEEPVRAMNIYGLEHHFVETLGLDVINGRAPSEAFPSDSAQAVLLNRRAADILAETVPGWEDPIGKRVQVDEIMAGQVIGVVEDFHFASLHASINPLVLFFSRGAQDKVFVRVRPGDVETTLASLEQDWRTVAPDLPFSYTFLDDHIAALYARDQQFARLVMGLALLTILVACLGLYGIVVFVTQRRAKEIGIRKVLGASAASLMGLLSRRFLRYVVLANLIAWPLAYVGLQRWLDGFAYRVPLSPWLFLGAGLATLALAWLTMSYQTILAALADPVKSLRYE